MILFFALTGCCCVTRADILKIPFFGPALQYGVQCIGVDRSNGIGRKNAVKTINNHIKNKATPPILICPSGTTCNQNNLITFRTGAFTPGVPVQPFIIKYKNKYANLTFSADHYMLTVFYYALC